MGSPCFSSWRQFDVSLGSVLPRYPPLYLPLYPPRCLLLCLPLVHPHALLSIRSRWRSFDIEGLPCGRSIGPSRKGWVYRSVTSPVLPAILWRWHVHLFLLFLGNRSIRRGVFSPVRQTRWHVIRNIQEKYRRLLIWRIVPVGGWIVSIYRQNEYLWIGSSRDIRNLFPAQDRNR